MKLKFRADSKDAIIFGIFAVFLLYLVAIGVLNLSSFASLGKFYGLNPIEAFTGDFIAPTIIFYLIALGSFFFTTGTYFFDLEEGFGFSVGAKKEKGYNRWANAKEMKKELKLVYPHEENTKHAGIPLINDGKEIWVDDSEYHNLVIGATGSGKTTAIIYPMVRLLAKHNESMIITDPKGEIYEKMSVMLRARGYNIILLNFRNPQNGNSWNPLTLPYNLYKNGNPDKAMELLDDLALNILYDETNKNADPFWEKTSADYFSGIALGLFEDADPTQININSISLTTTIGEEKFGGSTYIKEYFNGKDPNGAAFINASSTIMAPSETKGSILAVFKQKIRLFASRENLSEMLSYSDFDLSDIGKKKTALFIIIQDEKKTYHPLATILLKQCYETLIDVAQANGGKLPVRTNFLVDEFANMPPLKDITTMITAARSRQIRFTLIIQNFAQLNEVYGKENAETIKGNCGNMIYLISTELAALEEISKMCGEVKSKEKDKTASTPLVTVTDLQKLKLNEVIIRRLRLSPFKTKLKAEYEMNWGKSYPKAEYPIREKRSISIFDVRAYVKEKKKAKMNDLLNMDMSSDSPGGFNSNMPPFFNQNMFTPPPTMRDNNFGFPNMPGMPNMAGNNGNNSDFNIDELVKKIDQKIAELEEEEKRNNASLANESKVLPNNTINGIKEVPSLPFEAKSIESSPINNDYLNGINNFKKDIGLKELEEEKIPIPIPAKFEEKPLPRMMEPANINYRDLYLNEDNDEGGTVKEAPKSTDKSIHDFLENEHYKQPVIDFTKIPSPIVEEKKIVEIPLPKEVNNTINIEEPKVDEQLINNIFNNFKNSVENTNFNNINNPVKQDNNSFNHTNNWFEFEKDNAPYAAARRNNINNEEEIIGFDNKALDPISDLKLNNDDYIYEKMSSFEIPKEEIKEIEEIIPKPQEKITLDTTDLFKPKDANINWFNTHEEDIKNASIKIDPEKIVKTDEEPTEEQDEKTGYNEITDDQFFDDFFDD